MRIADPIELSDEERSKWLKRAHSGTVSVRLARRAGMILRAADGFENKIIGEMIGAGRVQVATWRKRYVGGGLAAIARDRPRGGRKRIVNAAESVRLSTQTIPEAATQWSPRTLAVVAGVSDTAVQRVGRAHGLKPHRVRRFKVSRDPRFAEKLEDIVGLYMNPPEHALVLCCDEKSQVQALDRTQPGLPLKKGRAATMTHDYKRHGTPPLVCRAQHARWFGHLALHAPPPAHRVAGLPAPNRARNPEG